MRIWIEEKDGKRYWKEEREKGLDGRMVIEIEEKAERKWKIGQERNWKKGGEKGLERKKGIGIGKNDRNRAWREGREKGNFPQSHLL